MIKYSHLGLIQATYGTCGSVTVLASDVGLMRDKGHEMGLTLGYSMSCMSQMLPGCHKQALTWVMANVVKAQRPKGSTDLGVV